MTILEKTKQLWQDVFNDSDDFVNIYFSRIYNNSLNYNIELQGKVIAALQAIEFSFKTGNAMLKSAYLSGIATSPEHRRKGYMRQLLDTTHQSLRDKGFQAAWLIPAERYLFGIYETFGYKTFFYKDYTKIDTSTINHKTGNITTDIFQKKEIDHIYAYFHKNQLKQSSGVILPRYFFDVVVDVFGFENNHIIVAKEGTTIVGLAFMLPKGNIVKLISDNTIAEQAILDYVYNKLDIKHISLKTCNKSTPYGMILIFDKSIELHSNLQPQVSLMLDE